MLDQGMIPSPFPRVRGLPGSPHFASPEVGSTWPFLGLPDHSKSPLQGGMMGEGDRNPPTRKSCQMPYEQRVKVAAQTSTKHGG